MNGRGRGILCCIIGNFNFVLVNHVAIGYIILMVSVRALVFLLFSWQSLRNDGQHLAFSYTVRTSGQPELCGTRGEASGQSSASSEVIKVLASHRIFLISGRPL